MKKTLDARVLALESVNAPDVSRRLILLTQFDRDDSDVVGIHSGGPRLLDVPRLAGETLQELIGRAAAMITGAGPMLVALAYRDDEPDFTAA